MSDDNKTPDNPDETPPNDPLLERLKEARKAIFEDDDEEDLPEDTIESLRAERDDLNAQLARLSAVLAKSQSENLTLVKIGEELTRLRKQDQTKFEQDKKFAIEKFVQEILPVVDTFEMGLKAIPQDLRDSDPKYARLAEGFEKTLGQLTAAFNKFGVREINPLMQAFDENKHEALTVQPKDGVDPETVISVMQKGYEIEGRVIRPAKVVVTPL